MQNQDRDARKIDLGKIDGASELGWQSSDGHDTAEEPGASDLQLKDTIVVRDPFQNQATHGIRAAAALASGRRAVRLLWIALTISLAAHLVIPAYIVSATTRSEKVALMDGT